MAPLKKMYIVITIIILSAVLIILYSGIISVEPLGLTISSATLESHTIKMGKNTTITIVIENTASESKTFELHIIYTNSNLTFYDKITGTLLPLPDKSTQYYNITYPTKGTIDVQGKVEIPILVKGPEPIGNSQTYTIFLEVFSLNDPKKTLSDKKSVQLTVTR